MKGADFNRLVENIKHDGCLTSLPLVYRDGDILTVVSGNHRFSAAIKAGIEESDLIEVTSPLTRQQFVALQLSHNAIVGRGCEPKLCAQAATRVDAFGRLELAAADGLAASAAQ
jgi:hypothetical protein